MPESSPSLSNVNGKRSRWQQDNEPFADTPPRKRSHSDDKDGVHRSASSIIRSPWERGVTTATDAATTVVSPPSLLPLAPTLDEFLAPGGSRRYRPREEWYRTIASANTTTGTSNNPCHTDDESPTPVYRSARAVQAFFLPTAAAARRDNDNHPNDEHRDEDLVVEDVDVLIGLIRQGREANSSRQQQQQEENGVPQNSQAPTTPTALPTEPALLLAIRENATEAALVLMEAGASVTLESVKGVTPLVLAAQKGNLPIVKALLQHGANPASVASNGSTALLQAAHFGHRSIVQLLLSISPPHTPLAEMANLNLTTPLMRAAQEGHEGIVLDLLRGGAQVNRRNRCHMSALMLASQRGHANICQHLIHYGADVDARTNQDSTSLLLACKRSHVPVVDILVTAGCELWVKDSRGRTARDVVLRRQELLAQRNNNDPNTHGTQRRVKAMLGLLDSTVQRHLMRCAGRKIRSADLILHWNLLQQDRATVAAPLCADDQPPISLQDVPALLANPTSRLPYPLGLSSTQALLRTMLMPAPLVQLIASFMPLPNLWERSIGMLTRRATIHPDETVVTALDLLDEILEEGGLVEACDAAIVPPPSYFATWRDWKAFGRRRGQVESEAATSRERPNVTLAVVPTPAKPQWPTLVEHRRVAGFLSLLANYASLERVLQGTPYFMPPGLTGQLMRTADLASLVRRMGSSGGIHFESAVAMDLVMLVSRLCAWYWRHSENVASPRSTTETQI